MGAKERKVWNIIQSEVLGIWNAVKVDWSELKFCIVENLEVLYYSAFTADFSINESYTEDNQLYATLSG